VIGPGPFGREQQEHQVDGLVVQRIEIHGRFQPCEHAGDMLDADDLAVRDGDAIADAGRAEPFPLQDGLEYLPLRNA